MLLDPLKSVHDFIGILVDVTVLIAAYVAAKEYVNFGHRWTSDLKCSHHDLPDSHVVFTANYTLKNTGRRELEVKKVTIRVTALKEDKQEDTVLLVADETKTYAKRDLFPGDDPAHKGLYHIQPGERAIFPLRAKLPKLDDAVFVLCQCELEKGPHPAQYRGFYVKPRPTAAESQKTLSEKSAV